MNSTPRVKAGLAAGALLLTGSLIGWSAAAGGAASAAPAPGAPATATVAEGAANRTIGGAVDSYASVVEKVSPAVVTIRSEHESAESVRRATPSVTTIHSVTSSASDSGDRIRSRAVKRASAPASSSVPTATS